jgi:ankyrin
VVELLLKEKNLNVNVNATCKYGYSALHIACFRGYVKLVKILLEHSKILVNATSDDGYTPLHICARKGFVHLVHLLLQHKANIEAVTKEGIVIDKQ